MLRFKYTLENQFALGSLVQSIVAGVLLFACFCAIHWACQQGDRYQDYSSTEQVLASGKRLFNRHCASCHTLQHQAIGPPLGGVTKLFAKEVLIALTKNPNQLDGDRLFRSKYLRKKYSSVMPAFHDLDTVQIGDIFAFIHHQSQELSLEPLQIDTSQLLGSQLESVRPVEPSRLYIELETYAQLPRKTDQPGDKGIATLRPHPSADGSLLISDQMGIIYHIVAGKTSLFLNLADLMADFIYAPGIGTGLGSFDLDPEFLQNRLFYTTHAEKYLGKPAINDGVFPDSVGVGLQWVLSEWQANQNLKTANKNSRREVLRLNTPTTAHGLQDIGFAPNLPSSDEDYGLLFLGIGDGGSNNIKLPHLADTKYSLLGTVLRIDPQGRNSGNGQYGIPNDNPFAQDTNPSIRKEIWAYGFRNPHRMCWDNRSSKKLIVADIGEANIEEVNIVEKGGHYGWSNLEGSFGIDTKKDKKVIFAVNEETRVGFIPPLVEVGHTDMKAISGGYVYAGKHEPLRDKYIFGDIVTGKLFFMNMDQRSSDAKVYQLNISDGGLPTTLRELTGANRVHLRIGYNRLAGDLYIMTKSDASLRMVTKVFQK